MIATTDDRKNVLQVAFNLPQTLLPAGKWMPLAEYGLAGNPVLSISLVQIYLDVLRLEVCDSVRSNKYYSQSGLVVAGFFVNNPLCGNLLYELNLSSVGVASLESQIRAKQRTYDVAERCGVVVINNSVNYNAHVAVSGVLEVTLQD